MRMRIVSCSWNFSSQANFFSPKSLFHQLFTPSKCLFLFRCSITKQLWWLFLWWLLHVCQFCLHSYIWFAVVHVSPLVQFGKFLCTYTAFYWFHFIHYYFFYMETAPRCPMSPSLSQQIPILALQSAVLSIAALGVCCCVSIYLLLDLWTKV